MPSQKVAIVITLLSIVAFGGGTLVFLNQNQPNQTQNTQSVPSQFNQAPPSNNPQPQTQPIYQESFGGYGFTKPFYEKDGVSFQHYWPGDGSFSKEETEILVINESSLPVQIKSFNMTYSIDNESYSQKSGTWEKFPSKQGWDKIEYLNISPQYYKGEPLTLKPGEKGKIHHHIQASKDIPSSKDQKVNVNLVYTLDGEEVSLEKELVRDTRASEGSVPQENH